MSARISTSSCPAAKYVADARQPGTLSPVTGLDRAESRVRRHPQVSDHPAPHAAVLGCRCAQTPRMPAVAGEGCPRADWPLPASACDASVRAGHFVPVVLARCAHAGFPDAATTSTAASDRLALDWQTAVHCPTGCPAVSHICERSRP